MTIIRRGGGVKNAPPGRKLLSSPGYNRVKDG